LRRAANPDAALIADGDAQLGALLAMKRRLDQAGPAALVAMRAEIAVVVAAATGIAQQAQAALGSGSGHEAVADLAGASDAARREVGSFIHDFYERKIFDPYLRFASVEDEEAYREREADYQFPDQGRPCEGHDGGRP